MSNLDLPGIALGFMREEFVHDLDRADVGRTLAKSSAGSSTHGVENSRLCGRSAVGSLPATKPADVSAVSRRQTLRVEIVCA